MLLVLPHFHANDFVAIIVNFNLDLVLVVVFGLGVLGEWYRSSREWGLLGRDQDGFSV